MTKKSLHRNEKHKPLARVLCIDDSIQRSNSISEYLIHFACHGMDFETEKLISWEDLLSKHRDLSSTDIVFFDACLTKGLGPDEWSQKKNWDAVSRVLRKWKNVEVIAYSSGLPGSSSVERLVDFADVWAIGPDEKQNMALAAKRAVDVLSSDSAEAYRRFMREVSHKYDEVGGCKSHSVAASKFEELCCLILQSVDGFQVQKKGLKRSLRGVDLVIQNGNTRDFWLENLGSQLIVECKSQKQPVSVHLLYELVGLLSLHSLRTAILILLWKLPRKTRKDLEPVLADATSSGKSIIILDKAAITSVIKGRPIDTIMKECSFPPSRSVSTDECIEDLLPPSPIGAKTPTIRWKQVEECFKRRGYAFYPRGGDIFIAEPSRGKGILRSTVRIKAECCNSPNAIVSRPFLHQIVRVFGVTFEDILAG